MRLAASNAAGTVRSAMTKPINNSANQQNANKGSNGTNKAYDKAQGNRGYQMNPQNPANQGRGKNTK
jgi:hypothetical protein